MTIASETTPRILRNNKYNSSEMKVSTSEVSQGVFFREGFRGVLREGLHCRSDKGTVIISKPQLVPRPKRGKREKEEEEDISLDWFQVTKDDNKTAVHAVHGDMGH